MDSSKLRERVDYVRETYANDPFRLAQELRKLLREAEKLKDVYAIGKINLLLAVCIFYQGGRTSILSYAYKAVSLLETLDDHRLLARSYNLMGVAYAAQGSFQQAISVYKKALKLIRGRKNPGIRKETLLNNVAQCYSQMGEYRQSIRLVKDCLTTVRTKRPNLHSAAVIYGLNLSDFYEHLMDYKTAIAYLDDVKPDSELLNPGVILWGYYARRSCVLYKLGDLEEAAKYADLTIEAVRTGCDSYEGHSDFEKIAFSQVQVGDYDRATIFADMLTKYAEENGNTLDHIIANRVRANICYTRGERAEAYALYKELNALYETWTREQNAIQYESQKSMEAASREIDKLMKKALTSEERAERDPLTGLLNRSALVSVTDSFIRSAKEKGKKLGGIFFDIDYFKEYNDTYGHAAGDEALKFIAGTCRELESANVKFFRYGGDEFFGIVHGQKDEKLKALACGISERVRDSGIAHAKNPNGQRLTVSIGVINVDMNESDYTILDLINRADKALYQAKDSGRDRVCMVDD